MASRAVDMSEAAVARRLEELAQLYELGLSLRRARVLGPIAGGRAPIAPGPEESPRRDTLPPPPRHVPPPAATRP